MAIFDKTPRTASDLLLTRTNQPFSKDVSQRLQTQKSRFNFQIVENQRLREIKRQTMEAESQRLIEIKRQTMEAESQRLIEIKRQKEISQKIDKIKSKSEKINFDLADKISKVIPYSLIPVVAITAGYLLLKGKK